MRLGKLASRGAAVFALVLGSVLPSSPALVQTVPVKLVPFNDFLKEVSRAAPSSYLTRPKSAAKTAAAFDEMRQHILSMYDGVSVRHSFLLGSDTFDCIPIMQQPTARFLSLKSLAPEPPPLPVPNDARPSPATGPPVIRTGQIEPGHAVDALGNSVICEDGTIPMRRITLEELTRFETLRQFFPERPRRSRPVSNPWSTCCTPCAQIRALKTIGGKHWWQLGS
jgi:hypothetical protein